MARFFLIRIPATSKELNTTPGGAIRAAALATTMLATAAPCWSADVTVDRLINADKEPQNWLMNHRTYDGQRFSPLTRIDRGNTAACAWRDLFFQPPCLRLAHALGCATLVRHAFVSICICS